MPRLENSGPVAGRSEGRGRTVKAKDGRDAIRRRTTVLLMVDMGC